MVRSRYASGRVEKEKIFAVLGTALSIAGLRL
jgi:hypothetical protein